MNLYLRLCAGTCVTSHGVNLQKPLFSPLYSINDSFIKGDECVGHTSEKENKGIYLLKALTCMQFFLCNYQGDGYLWSNCCINNVYISHRSLYDPTYNF